MPLKYKAINPQSPQLLLSPFSNSHTESLYSPCPKSSHGTGQLEAKTLWNCQTTQPPTYLGCLCCLTHSFLWESQQRLWAGRSPLCLPPPERSGCCYVWHTVPSISRDLWIETSFFMIIISVFAILSYLMKTNPRYIFRTRSHIVAVRNLWIGLESPDCQSLVFCMNALGRSSRALLNGMKTRRVSLETTKRDHEDKLLLGNENIFKSSKQMYCSYGFWKYLQKSRKCFCIASLCLFVEGLLRNWPVLDPVPKLAHLDLSRR